MEETELTNNLEEKFHDGPFGPVEFGCFEIEEEEKTILFINHFKVHKDYQGHGYGKETLKKVLDYISQDDRIDKISMSIGGGEVSKEFFEKIGFSDVELKSDGMVTAVEDVSELRKRLN